MFKNPLIKQIAVTVLVIIVFNYVVKEYKKMKAAQGEAKVVELAAAA